MLCHTEELLGVHIPSDNLIIGDGTRLAWVAKPQVILKQDFQGPHFEKLYRHLETIRKVTYGRDRGMGTGDRAVSQRSHCPEGLLLD